MYLDLPLTELRTYRPAVLEPPDFDDFWDRQRAEAAAHPLDVRSHAVPTPLTHADVFDVSFSGHGGNRITAWLLAPHTPAPKPSVVVEFVGYGGGRGAPLDWLTYSCAGHPHLIMDTRGQGGGYRRADTPDPADTGAPSTPGFLTRGIESPQTYYYTRLFIDAARAVAAASTHAVARGLSVVTTGGSQGGGLALAAAHLGPGVAATMPDVPFLADFARAVKITDAKPYGELIEYWSVNPDRIDAAQATLSYIDVVNHARRTHVPALFSVGLIDPVTPASTVFAAYNHYAGSKGIEIYPFNGHEGGGTGQLARKLSFLGTL